MDVLHLDGIFMKSVRIAAIWHLQALLPR